MPSGDAKCDSTIVTYTTKRDMFATEGSAVSGVIKGKSINAQRKSLDSWHTSYLGLCRLMSDCWTPNPTERPSSAELLKDVVFTVRHHIHIRPRVCIDNLKRSLYHGLLLFLKQSACRIFGDRKRWRVCYRSLRDDMRLGPASQNLMRRQMTRCHKAVRISIRKISIKRSCASSRPGISTPKRAVKRDTRKLFTG